MLRPPRIALFCLLLLLPRLLAAQFAGTYVVGAGGDFATLAAALTALRNAPAPQMAGHVTLLLSDGTHTPPTGGFVIPELSGSGPNAILTIRPAPGAAVVIQSGTTPALIDLNGADYVVVDGRDSLDGGSLRIVCTAATGSAVRFVNGATHDTLRNITLIGNGSSSTYGVVRFDGSNTGTGNADNLVVDNVIGDTSGTLRANAGVTMIGTAAAPNLRNRVLRNDIVNPGHGSGVAYGLYLGSNNQRVVIEGNEIHCTADAGTENLHPFYGLYMTNSANQEDSIARNRIHSLLALNPGAARYGIYISNQGTSPIHLIANMISLRSDSGLLAGIYTTEPDTVYAIANSILLSGNTTTSASTYGIASSTKGRLWIHDNLIVVDRPSSTRGPSRCLSLSSIPYDGIIDHNGLIARGDSVIPVARGTVLYDNINSWSDDSGFDSNSVSGDVSFIDAESGGLHIDPVGIFCGEGLGSPINCRKDFDGETRDTLRSDIGADEGDFNGGRLRLIDPRDTVVIVASTAMQFTVAATRAATGSLELVDSIGEARELLTADLDATELTSSIRIPAVLAGRYLLRLVNPLNGAEADSSPSPFIVMNPKITIDSITGADEIVEGDTLNVVWHAIDCPPTAPLELAITTDSGSSWRLLDTALFSDGSGGVVVTPWVVPIGSSGSCRLRMTMRDGVQGDTTAPFTVVPTPTIDVDVPPVVPADRILIVRWNAPGCRYVRVRVSTDGGDTWHPLIAGDPRIPAWIGRASGRIPNVDSSLLIVRVVDARHPHIGRSVSIRLLHPSLVCRTPQRGTRARIGDAIDIVWSGRDIERLRIEYSENDGNTWTTIVEGVDGSNGWRRYTPAQRPTATARVRMTDMDDPDRRVVSDRFTILPAVSILPTSPVTGQTIERGSTIDITWESEGVERVSLYYTTNGGATWTSIALDVPAAYGSHRWTVPARAYEAMRIRIRQSGGVIYGETGTFAIVDPVAPTPTLALLAPSQRWPLIAGDEIRIQWRATGFRGLVRIETSVDSGATWTDVGTRYVGVGRLEWVVPFDTNARVCVRVSSIDLDLLAQTPGALRVVAPARSRDSDDDEISRNYWRSLWRRIAGDGMESRTSLSIAPNPSGGSATLRWTVGDEAVGGGEVAIFDVGGACRERFAIDESAWGRGEIRVDIADLPEGLYLARLVRGDDVRTVTFLRADR